MSEKQSSEANNLESVEILIGDKAKAALQPAIVKNLIWNLVKSTFKAPPIDASMTSDQVQEILEQYGYPASFILRGKLTRLFNLTTPYDEGKLKEMIEIKKSQQMEWTLEDAAEITASGNMIAASVDGIIVGILGYKKVGSKNGKSVYEIKRASMLPDYSGQGIYKKMANEVIKLIVKKDPNVIIVRDTFHPGVLKTAQSQGFKLISCTEYCSLHDGWDPPSKEFEQMQDKQGRKYLKQEFGENH